jgi:tetratricopeptide (TPR) repeat protein
VEEFSKFINKRDATVEPSEASSKKPVHNITPMPNIQNFVGREKELMELREWINSPNKPIIVICGIAGIGKSALSAKMASEWQKRNLFWFRFHEWNTLRNMADEFAKFFSQCGRRQLSLKLRGSKNIDITELGNLFYDGISGLSAAIFLDDAQKANSQLLSFLSYIVEQWDSSSDVGIIIMSREQGKFYDSKDVVVRRAVKELSLDGLDEVQSRELLGPEFKSGFPEIYGVTKGHPLFLELLRSLGKTEYSKDINTFLEHEILSGLNPQEKDILEALCVFQYPVPIPQILKEDMDYSLVSSLTQKGLVKETQNNLVESHELIKDFIYHRLPQDRIQTLHKNAGEYYLELSRTKKIVEIEGLVHLLKAGELKSSLDFAMENGNVLEEMDLPRVKQLFSQFRTDHMSKIDLANFLFLKGEVLAYYEEWNEALENFRECLELGQNVKMEPEILAKVHNRIGEMQRSIQKWEETISSHLKALDLFKKAGDKKSLAKEHLSLGIIYKEMRDFQNAQDHYKLAKEILTNISDKKGIAAVYNNLGMLNMDMGKFALAKECFDLGLKLAEAEKDLLSRAITIQNLGDLALSRMNYDEAIKNFQESQNILIRENKIKEAQELALRIGDVYLEIDEPERAIENFKGGLVIEREIPQEIAGKKKLFRTRTKDQSSVVSKTIAKLHSKIAYVYRELQMWKECQEHRGMAIGIFIRLQNPNDIAQEHLEAAYDYEDQRNYERAIDSLKRGLDLVRRDNNRGGIVAINLNLARIYSKTNLGEKAISASNEALNTAEEIGYWVGAKRACEMLLEFYEKDEDGKRRYSKKLIEINRKL